MAKPPSGEFAAEAKPAPHTKRRRFEAPAELDKKFGAHTVTDDYIQGLVATADIPDLLAAFGLTEVKDYTLPYQHMKRQQGELWGLRIELAQHHVVDGAPVLAHVWSFQNHTAERVQEAQ